MLRVGRLVGETAQRRATPPDSDARAACFGTRPSHAILAHLQRSILHARTSEHALLVRAARGPGSRLAEPAERTAAPGDRTAEAQLAGKSVRPLGWRAGWDDPELRMPSLQELKAQIRCRPLGQTLAEIRHDLSMVPGFSAGAFWNELGDSARQHDGSLAALMQEMTRRPKALDDEPGSKPTSGADAPHRHAAQGAQGTRRQR